MIVTDQIALSLLLTGSTHYLVTDATAPGKEAAIYYATPGEAHMRLPSGVQWRGSCGLTPTGYHVDWTGGPSAAWQIDAEPGHIVYRDAEGIERGALTRIVPGDAEGLAA